MFGYARKSDEIRALKSLLSELMAFDADQLSADQLAAREEALAELWALERPGPMRVVLVED